MDIYLCMVVDDNCVRMAARCIHDILIRQNLDTYLKIVIIYDKVSKKITELAKLQSRRCELLLVNADSEAIGICRPSDTKSNTSCVKYLKFLIPHAIRNINRILYIDCDMFCRRDLSELYCMDLHGCPIGLVKKYDVLLEDNPSNAIFDTGLMLMDLPKLREVNFIEHCLTVVSMIDVDHEIISAVVKDYCYCLQPSCQVPIHMLARKQDGSILSHDIYTINDYFGSSYRSLDDLFDNSFFYHFCGDKSYWWELPEIKRYIDISDTRLKLYHLTNSLVKITKKDDESVEMVFRLMNDAINEQKAKVIQMYNPVKIDWSKYFDRVYCIHSASSRQQRKQAIDNELERIGLLHSPVFQYLYTTSSPFDQYIKKSILANGPDFSTSREAQTINLILAHYRIYQEAVGQDFKHILILEDDIRFIQNIRLIVETLDHMPNDYDYIHFDKVLSTQEAYRLNTMIRGEYYYNNYTGGYFGGGCQAYSYKALQRGISILEHCLYHADFLFEGRDDSNINDLKRYVPIARLVYQDTIKHFYYSEQIW